MELNWGEKHTKKKKKLENSNILRSHLIPFSRVLYIAVRISAGALAACVRYACDRGASLVALCSFHPTHAPQMISGTPLVVNTGDSGEIWYFTSVNLVGYV